MSFSAQRKRCWLNHRFYEGWDSCPLCYSKLKWIKTLEGWTPCDSEPILFIKGKGMFSIIKRRELLLNCRIYTPGMKLKKFEKIEKGLMPHVYTCEELRR